MAPLITLRAQMRTRDRSLPLIQLLGDITQRSGAGPRDFSHRAATDRVEVYGDLAAHIPGGISARTSWADLAAPEALRAMAAL
ncbi:MAG: hypothetical protein D6773_02090, partial [Alphaproteobacteria bacterium]